MAIIFILQIFILILCLSPLLSVFLGRVPANTAIIIDRNTHYHKTVRRGFYFLIPGKDKVTTRVSTNKITKNYANNFETHDGRVVSIDFVATYHAENIDDVLFSLKSARRSIDDIIESSVYWAVNDLGIQDFIKDKNILLREIAPKLSSEARELCIKIDNFTINNMYVLVSSSAVKPFKPHLSSSTDSPITFN